MNFLNNTYERAATGSQYLKFAPNDKATIRIISLPVEGIEVWKDKKPLRWKFAGEMPKEAYSADDKPKPFAAFGVWHYEAKQYKIYQCSTRSVLQELANLNEVEGDPLSYDITITRKGASLDTKYYVKSSKPTELTEEVLQASQEFAANVDLGALFTGENPFK
tara:strand:+ start:2215 stop:2703 length:489 start_codon:yes stop_codon:yes gene_type:complete